jgi:hypothetical protein
MVSVNRLLITSGCNTVSVFPAQLHGAWPKAGFSLVYQSQVHLIRRRSSSMEVGSIEFSLIEWFEAIPG